MDEIHSAIERAVGTPFEYEIESVLPWIRRELVADSYGEGRVFLAGDAVHMTSPTGGLGMNTGIGDAVDLSWKLSAVLGGWGGPELLRSYEIERRPAALRITRESTGNLEAMLSPKDYVTPDLLLPGPAGDANRREVGERFSEAMRREWFSLGLHLGHRYDESAVIARDGAPLPPTGIGEYVQTARPGGRAPHGWLPDGRSTLDLFGRGFVLLRLGERPPEVRGLLAEARRRDIPLQVVTIDDPQVCAAYERPLVLVRPDGYVAWWSDHEPANPAALLATAAGHGVPDQTPLEELAVTQ